MTAESNENNSAALALPPPPSEEEAEQLVVNGPTQTYKFDKLGPTVVNSDGTLSRIANWETMTPPERERTLRVLVARNKLRLAQLQQQKDEDDELTICVDGGNLAEAAEEETTTSITSQATTSHA